MTQEEKKEEQAKLPIPETPAAKPEKQPALPGPTPHPEPAPAPEEKPTPPTNLSEPSISPTTPVEITVTKGRTVPGSTQYTSERIDYTLKMSTQVGCLVRTREIMEATIELWLPKMPTAPAPTQQEAKPPSQPTPAATPPPQPKQTIPLLATIEQHLLQKLKPDTREKLALNEDPRGNIIIQPKDFLGGERFKEVVTALNDLKKRINFESDYRGEGAGKHWIIFNPKMPKDIADAPRSAPAASEVPAENSMPTSTLDPDALAKLPWRKYHEGNPNAWIFANTPGAEALFAMLQHQRDNQHINEVPVLIGDTMFDCKIGKDNDGKTDKFISRELPKPKK